MKGKILIGVVATTIVVATLVMGAGYFWNAVPIAKLNGTVEPVKVTTKVINISLGTLSPGEQFSTNEYIVNISHNVKQQMRGSIFLLSKEKQSAFSHFTLSGWIENQDTNEKQFISGDLAYTTIYIPYVPNNSTVMFSIKGQAGLSNEKIDLSNIQIMIGIYPIETELG